MKVAIDAAQVVVYAEKVVVLNVVVGGNDKRVENAKVLDLQGFQSFVKLLLQKTAHT